MFFVTLGVDLGRPRWMCDILAPGCYTWQICLSGSTVGRRGWRGVSSWGNRDAETRQEERDNQSYQASWEISEMANILSLWSQLQRWGGSVVVCLVLFFLPSISSTSVSLLLHLFCPLASCCLLLYSVFALLSSDIFTGHFCCMPHFPDFSVFSLLACLFLLLSFASGPVVPWNF